LEKAYDTVWKEYFLIKLQEMERQGRMFNWIQQFFIKRSFKVKVGNEVSESYKIGCGLLQGSVISSILFNVFVME